jgi:cobalt/nickel transport system permease protein
VRDSSPDPRRGRLNRYWWLAGLGIAALVVIVFAPLASSDPDGLERVAEDAGFIERARAAVYSILPDYTVPGIDGTLSTILAGLIGIAIVFGLMTLLGRLLARRSRRD